MIFSFCSHLQTLIGHNFCRFISIEMSYMRFLCSTIHQIRLFYFNLFYKFHIHHDLIHFCWIFALQNWLKALTNLIIFLTNNQRTNKNMVGLYPVCWWMCVVWTKANISQSELLNLLFFLSIFHIFGVVCTTENAHDMYKQMCVCIFRPYVNVCVYVCAFNTTWILNVCVSASMLRSTFIFPCSMLHVKPKSTDIRLARCFCVFECMHACIRMSCGIKHIYNCVRRTLCAVYVCVWRGAFIQITTNDNGHRRKKSEWI